VVVKGRDIICFSCQEKRRGVCGRAGGSEPEENQMNRASSECLCFSLVFAVVCLQL